jgi:hypothetical protein
MPVNAVRLLRKMRGGAQAHLLEADDHRCYVVKFLNNPQHRRVLINEWIASTLLRHLEIAQPTTVAIVLSEDFLRENPEVAIQLGSTRQAVVPGWHFGSQYPGDPARTAVYDFLPDSLLSKVYNVSEFLGILAFDKWTGNADARQSIFVRARVREWVSRSVAEHPLKLAMVVLMVDHGFLFNGPHWEFVDSPLQGLYFRTQVYADVRGWDDFAPWLDRIAAFPEHVIDDALRTLPPQWLDRDDAQLEALLERLLARRNKVPDLLRDCARGRVNVFPKWHL